jgi:hypothetical protein
VISECFYADSDYAGYGFANKPSVTTWYDCYTACLGTANCNVYTYYFSVQICYFKNGRLVIIL